jgi:hypothetical protein
MIIKMPSATTRLHTARRLPRFRHDIRERRGPTDPLEAPLPVQAVRVRTLITTLTGALVLATGAAGCGDDTSDLPPPAPSPPPGSSGEASPDLELSPAEAEAVAEARAKFDEFMTAYIEVSTADIPTADQAEALFAQVDQHVGGGQLSQSLRAEIIGHWGQGQVSEGQLGWESTDLLEVDLEREIAGQRSPAVSLQYCVDATAWSHIDADTQELVSQPGERRFWHVTVVWSDDWFGQGIDGWRIRERDQSDEQC